MCNIEYAYRRFDGIISQRDEKLSLYTIALRTKNSLLQQLYTKQIVKWENKHHLISDAVIRITDVQWAIFDELLRTRDIHKNGNEAISAAYADIINLNIKLYPLVRKKKDGEKPHILKFEFLSILSTFLNTVNWNKIQELLYWSKLDVMSEQLEAFSKNMTEVFGPIMTKQLPRVEIRRLVREAARLSGMEPEQRRTLSTNLTQIFPDKREYSVQEVYAKMMDISQLYINIKSK